MRLLTETEISEIIADAWDDETSFEDVNYKWGLSEKDTKVLITGSAGFIGFHLARTFLVKKNKVLGIDGMTEFYDINLKKKRNKILAKYKNFSFHEMMLEDSEKLFNICLNFYKHKFVKLCSNFGVR